MEPQNSWQHTQNADYLKLIRDRVEKVDLTWVLQFLDILKINFGADKLSIKDIGCQAFQFYKVIKKNELPYEYYGYELDRSYIDIGLEHFPELIKNFYLGDFTQCQDIRTTDISVCSATIEHVDNWVMFLEKMLSSTTKMVIIRSFLGETSERISVRAIGAKADYPIWQFSYRDFLQAIDKLGWKPKIMRDNFTDSLPIYKSYGSDLTGVVELSTSLSPQNIDSLLA